MKLPRSRNSEDLQTFVDLKWCLIQKAQYDDTPSQSPPLAFPRPRVPSPQSGQTGFRVLFSHRHYTHRIQFWIRDHPLPVCEDSSNTEFSYTGVASRCGPCRYRMKLSTRQCRSYLALLMPKTASTNYAKSTWTHNHRLRVQNPGFSQVFRLNSHRLRIPFGRLRARHTSLYAGSHYPKRWGRVVPFPARQSGRGFGGFLKQHVTTRNHHEDRGSERNFSR